MDRHELADLYQIAHTQGVWCAPWSRALDDLTPKEAAWQPAAGRHSIWQIVNHIAFWREYQAARSRGGANLPDDVVFARNFEAPAVVSDEAWNAGQARLAEAYETNRQAMLDPTTKYDRLEYALAHDNYHFGQIMYLRAMLGKPAIE